MLWKLLAFKIQQKQLKKAIEVVTRKVQEDSTFSHINEVCLYKIIVNESSKSFMTKAVDKENKDGYFETYKRLIHRLEDIILNINPKYDYPLALATTIMDGTLNQHFLNEHFPSLTNFNNSKKNTTTFFTELILNSLK